MNLPKAFEERLSSERDDAPAILKALHQEAPTSIRINPFKTGNPDLEAVPWNKYGYYLPERPVFTGDPLLHAGAYYVQEASSMLIGSIARKLFPAEEHRTILDLCAAPGGKSTNLATWAHEQEHWLISNEIIPKRARVLQENLIKWGLTTPTVLNNAPAELGHSLHGMVDLLVIDAPCSGEGLFRKDPKSVMEWSPETPQQCAFRQKQILKQAWPMIKAGGYLIYSTCTFARCENEEIVAWAQHTFYAETIALDDIAGPVGDAENGYRMLPHRIKGEGFFVAVFQKSGPEERTLKGKPQQLRFRQNGVHWDSSTFAVHPHFERLNQKQLQDLNVIQPGVQLTDALGKPTHSSVLHVDHAPELPEIPLEAADAIRYLKRESLPFSFETGMVTLSFQGTTLGLGKSIGNRINNLYPKGWRIINPAIQAGFSLSDY